MPVIKKKGGWGSPHVKGVMPTKEGAIKRLVAIKIKQGKIKPKGKKK